jgi:trehalose 6-phosphate synthase
MNGAGQMKQQVEKTTLSSLPDRRSAPVPTELREASGQTRVLGRGEPNAGPGRLTAPRPDMRGGPSGPAGRLVVVSNRVPAPTGRANAGAGGLAVALEAALKEHGGVWFGWSGEARSAIDADALDVRKVGRITFAVTDLTRRDVDDYYLGFSNRALWPVCHYRLDLARFSAKETAAYFRVNELFARKLSRVLEPGDLIWVHDYHLIPLGQNLRERGVEDRIGFFFHIPWAPYEVASALPEFRRLLESMAAYDLIGFQTYRDAENFGRCLVESGVAAELGDGWFEGGGRRFRVGAFPIGIDVDAFRQAAEGSRQQAIVKRMAATLGGRKLVIGVDRLDYSKGIRERILAFCSYLAMNADEKGRVTYLQVTPKSRSDVPEYKTIQREVAAQVGEANGAHGDPRLDPDPLS